MKDERAIKNVNDLEKFIGELKENYDMGNVYYSDSRSIEGRQIKIEYNFLNKKDKRE